MIGPGIMRRLTYILPVFCLLLSSAMIVYMYAKRTRLTNEAKAARQELRRLQADVRAFERSAGR